MSDFTIYHNPRCLKSRITGVPLAAAMAAPPQLIERPGVGRGERAVPGRPPAQVLELIG